MKKVYKYTLNACLRNNILMPVGAQILSAQYQVGTGICVWALVDPDAPREDIRIFHVIGTGISIDLPDDTLKFIDTIQVHPIVLHIFEEIHHS